MNKREREEERGEKSSSFSFYFKIMKNRLNNFIFHFFLEFFFHYYYLYVICNYELLLFTHSFSFFLLHHKVLQIKNISGHHPKLKITRRLKIIFGLCSRRIFLFPLLYLRLCNYTSKSHIGNLVFTLS